MSLTPPSKDALQQPRKSRIEILSPKPVHNDCSLRLRNDNATLTQDTEMMRKGGLRHIDPE